MSFTGSLEEKLTRKIYITFLYACVKLSKPKSEKLVNRMENLSSVFQKQKRKKNIKKSSFITQLKIEFLLPFTGCRKVLEKMPEYVF